MDYGRYLLRISGPQLVKLEAADKRDLGELCSEVPDVYKRLRSMLDRIEDHHRDVRFVEFVFEAGEIYLLQNTIRKRTPGVYRPRNRRS